MQARAKYQWDKPRLYLHLTFAACVLIQLLSSLEMRRPYLGRIITPLQSTAFSVHMYSGVLATLLVLSYWLWILKRNRSLLYHLFPWITRSGLQDIAGDIRGLLRLHLPNPALAGGLPGFIQGLGLLLVTWVGLLGTFLFFSLPKTQELAPWLSLIKETHGTFAWWMWWYVGGHGGMAIVHTLMARLAKFFP